MANVKSLLAYFCKKDYQVAFTVTRSAQIQSAITKKKKQIRMFNQEPAAHFSLTRTRIWPQPKFRVFSGS
jgi:hypothetical protein